MAPVLPTGNWSGGLHRNWVLWVVNGAGGQVVVCVAVVQVIGWQELRRWTVTWSGRNCESVLYKQWCLWEQLMYGERCAGGFFVFSSTACFVFFVCQDWLDWLWADTINSTFSILCVLLNLLLHGCDAWRDHKTIPGCIQMLFRWLSIPLTRLLLSKPVCKHRYAG